MYIIWETEVISSSVCVDDEHFSTHYFCIFPSFIQQNNTIHAVDDGVDVNILSGHIWHSTMVGNIPKPFEELRLQIFFFLVLLHFSYVSDLRGTASEVHQLEPFLTFLKKFIFF